MSKNKQTLENSSPDIQKRYPDIMIGCLKLIKDKSLTEAELSEALEELFLCDAKVENVLERLREYLPKEKIIKLFINYFCHLAELPAVQVEQMLGVISGEDFNTLSKEQLQKLKTASCICRSIEMLDVNFLEDLSRINKPVFNLVTKFMESLNWNNEVFTDLLMNPQEILKMLEAKSIKPQMSLLPVGTSLLNSALWIYGSAIVSRFISAGCDVNAHDYNGTIPLGHACAMGKEENVALLLKLGADPYLMDKSGSVPILSMYKKFDTLRKNNSNTDSERRIITMLAQAVIDRHGDWHTSMQGTSLLAILIDTHLEELAVKLIESDKFREIQEDDVTFYLQCALKNKTSKVASKLAEYYITKHGKIPTEIVDGYFKNGNDITLSFLNVALGKDSTKVIEDKINEKSRYLFCHIKPFGKLIWQIAKENGLNAKYVEFLAGIEFTSTLIYCDVEALKVYADDNIQEVWQSIDHPAESPSPLIYCVRRAINPTIRQEIRKNYLEMIRICIKQGEKLTNNLPEGNICHLMAKTKDYQGILDVLMEGEWFDPLLMLALLLEKNADGHTPVAVAKQNGNLEFINYILDKSVSKISKTSQTSEKYSLEALDQAKQAVKDELAQKPKLNHRKKPKNTPIVATVVTPEEEENARKAMEALLAAEEAEKLQSNAAASKAPKKDKAKKSKAALEIKEIKAAVPQEKTTVVETKEVVPQEKTAVVEAKETKETKEALIENVVSKAGADIVEAKIEKIVHNDYRNKFENLIKSYLDACHGTAKKDPSAWLQKIFHFIQFRIEEKANLLEELGVFDKSGIFPVNNIIIALQSILIADLTIKKLGEGDRNTAIKVILDIINDNIDKIPEIDPQLARYYDVNLKSLIAYCLEGNHIELFTKLHQIAVKDHDLYCQLAVSINQPFGMSMLHYAFATNNIEAAKMVLQGYSEHIILPQFYAILSSAPNLFWMAANTGKIEMVHLLEDGIRSVGLEMYVADLIHQSGVFSNNIDEGIKLYLASTLAIQAIKNQDIALFASLLAMGVKPDFIDRKGCKLIDHIDMEHNTALHMAIRNNHYPIVKMLIDHGANIYTANSYHLAPIDEIHPLSDPRISSLIATKYLETRLGDSETAKGCLFLLRKGCRFDYVGEEISNKIIKNLESSVAILEQMRANGLKPIIGQYTAMLMQEPANAQNNYFVR